MENFLIALSTEHQFLVYLLIILIAIIEGPILSILMGVLVKLGYFPLILTYIILMFGDILGDVIWYSAGRFFGFKFVQKYGTYFSLTVERIKIVEDIYHTYKKSILLISKLTTGFGFAIPILFTAGLVKIPFRMYLAINSLGQFIWTGILVGSGYFFSHLFFTFDSILARVSTIALFASAVLIFIGFSNYVKHKVTRT